MSRFAFLFPGQGAQAVGMGQSFVAEKIAAAQVVYDTFNTVVDPELSQICFEGPEDTLKRTLYTQPAILATSLAALQAFKSRCDLQPVAAVGHSLGEYGALFAAGAIDLETAAALVKERARLMENAPSGSMEAVLADGKNGFGKVQVEAILAELNAEGLGPVVLANDNTSVQWVISGNPAGIDASVDRLKAAGAKRVLPLSVGGAFHSPLMAGSATAFKDFLSGGFSFSQAQFPVVTNLDAQPTTDGEAFRQKLSQQIDHSVRWTETMAVLFNELKVDSVIEFGPGTVLTGMVKKDYPHILTYNVSDVTSLEATLAALPQAACV